MVPRHLSARSKQLFADITQGRKWSGPPLALLLTALETLDRLDQLRRAIGKGKLTVKTKRSGVVHSHPLLKAELETRRQFIHAWTVLGLEVESPFAALWAQAETPDQEAGGQCQRLDLD